MDLVTMMYLVKDDHYRLHEEYSSGVPHQNSDDQKRVGKSISIV